MENSINDRSVCTGDQFANSCGCASCRLPSSLLVAAAVQRAPGDARDERAAS